MARFACAVALVACGTMSLGAQTWPFPWPEDRIAQYTARRATAPIAVDGRLDEADWQAAERSPRFADLIGGRPGVHDTRAAVLWDDTHLYVGYWIDEPFVEATLKERDAPIYKNNDVELFIAGRDAYYEFEINAYGTIYEVLFIWERQFESSGYARRPEFDRTRDGVRPFNGVGFTQHPRGPRIGYWNWDLPGLETAVHVDGTINDNTDRDRGWTVELRIPWRSLEPLAMPDGRALPPKVGDEWRMDFSRFNQYKEAPPARDPGGWAWSPHGVWDSHVPELFTRVRFSAEPVRRAAAAAQPPASRPARKPTTRYARLYVFGDSYSDIGAGYVDGNGPTAVAYLGWLMGLDVVPAKAPHAADQSLVFAVSGAGTGEGEGRQVKDARLGYGMLNQIRDFAARVKAGEITFDPETTLFFLAGGLNDGRRETATTLGNLRQQLQLLRELGGKHFTLALLPTKIPQFAAVGQRLNPAYEQFVREEAARGLDLTLNRWGPAFDDVMTRPTAYGIANTTTACAGRAIFDQDATPVGDPSTYFFYHEGHPSTAVHRVVGKALYDELAGR